MMNMEVDKVFTVINPLLPLPEAVNVQFSSGEIHRIGVFSPWLPPICGHCSEVGHSLRRCPSAPILCPTCNSPSHDLVNCPKSRTNNKKQKERRLSLRQPLESALIEIPESSKEGKGTPKGESLMEAAQTDAQAKNQSKGNRSLSIDLGLVIKPTNQDQVKAKDAKRSDPRGKGKGVAVSSAPDSPIKEQTKRKNTKNSNSKNSNSSSHLSPAQMMIQILGMKI